MLTETDDSVEREGHAAYAERKKQRKETQNSLKTKTKSRTTQHNQTHLDPLFDLAYPFRFLDTYLHKEKDSERKRGSF